MKDYANVMNMVNYFETNHDIEDLENECSMQCYVSLSVWVSLFLSGLIYQYHCEVCVKEEKKAMNFEQSLNGAAYDNSYAARPIVINHYHQLRKE